MLTRFLICLFLSVCAACLTANRAEAREWRLVRGSAAVMRTTARVVLPPYPVARQGVKAVIGVERRQSRRPRGCGVFGCRR